MYLVRKRKAKTAHIWTGYDTVCRMYSTNGLRKIAYMVVATSDLPTCSMCNAKLMNTNNRQTLWPPLPVKPAQVEPWRPVMTEQERQEHEKYVQEHNLPF